MKYLDENGLLYLVQKIKTWLADKANATDLTSHTGNTTVHITSAERTKWNAAKTHADSAHAPSDAEANQNAFSNVKVGTTTIEADSKTDTLELAAGNNVTLTPDASGDKVTITAKDTTYGAATTSVAGLMSASDKSKLDGIATGAQANQNAFANVVVGSTTIAADSATDSLTLVAGTNVTLTPDATNDKVTITAKDTTYSAATQSANGLMSSTDKKKLDGIATGAEVNVQSDWSVTDTASDAYIKNKPTIPTNNNQLTNGAGYQTASQVNTAIANAVKDITSFEYEVVTSLPSTGVKGKIYLVAHAHGTGDAYDEYIWTGSTFEKIGNTDVDLSGYQKKCVVFNDGDTIVNLDELITNYNTGEVRYYYNYGGGLLPLRFIQRLSNGSAQINFEAMVNGTSYKALGSYNSGSGVCSWSTSTKDYVPATRTINGKALTANISLTAEDVGCTAITNAEIDTICAS